MCTIPGQELIENPAEYDSALPTFVVHNQDKKALPPMSSDSKIIFGNEIDCLIIEIDSLLTPSFYYGPLVLQQKTGQESIRQDAKNVLMVGGTDFTKTKISSKFFRFNVPESKVTELQKLIEGRFFPSFVEAQNHVFVIGGLGKEQKCLASCESIKSDCTPADPWKQIAPLSGPRVGQAAWAHQGKIYVYGGKDSLKGGKMYDTIEIYDIAANKWTVHGNLSLI